VRAAKEGAFLELREYQQRNAAAFENETKCRREVEQAKLQVRLRRFGCV